MADHGEGLVVSGGSSTRVGTDTLLALESAMRMLHTATVSWQATLLRIRALNAVSAPAWSARDPGCDVLAAAIAIDSVEAESRRLADALSAAAEGYGRAERSSEAAARVAAASLGWMIGRTPLLAALVALSALPALTAGVAIWLFRQALFAGGQPVGAVWRRPAGMSVVTGSDGHSVPPVRDRDGDPLLDPRLLTSPLAAALVRAAVASLDDAGIGAIGLPLAGSLALGDDGVGLLGVTTSAAGVLALSRPLGLLRETAVTVTPVRAGQDGASHPVPAVPPAGLADLASRIPTLSKDGGQVRVERYGPDASPAWVVYIGGTVDWGPVTATEPWDLASNLAAVAEEEAGSYRAVVQAMREAGIRPGEPVIEVGHSQGGLIAAQVAASGDFTSVATLTFGAPSGQVPIRDGVNTVAVEHTDDIVPGLGGTSADAAGRLLVRREVYASAPLPDGVSLPAHSMANYTETARLIDSSPEPRLRAFREQLTSVVGTSAGTAAVWRGTRTEGR